MYNKETVFSKNAEDGCLGCKCFDCVTYSRGCKWFNPCQRCYDMKDEHQMTTKCIAYEQINKAQYKIPVRKVI